MTRGRERGRTGLAYHDVCRPDSFEVWAASSGADRILGTADDLTTDHP